MTDISNSSNDFYEFRPTFNKYTMAFGIGVLGSQTVSNEALIHTAGVLAQFLDNDMNGEADTNVADNLARRNAVMLVTKDRAEYD